MSDTLKDWTACLGILIILYVAAYMVWETLL